ncbi:hypothetical protein CEXT_689091 [Caerostris extrusa]|uniref:Uncharacterized protein n=1 Tax=Caerostris extrusa TaxID=172846 RepID=A0AAV4PG84_CAEEX|nr:hypothetical protein CEXT_689091 [Caerostris extrusa]
MSPKLVPKAVEKKTILSFQTDSSDDVSIRESIKYFVATRISLSRIVENWSALRCFNICIVISSYFSSSLFKPV